MITISVNIDDKALRQALLLEGKSMKTSMTPQQAQELIDLLRETTALGLTFDCGTAYISRSYVDKQDELRERITAAIDLLEMTQSEAA